MVKFLIKSTLALVLVVSFVLSAHAEAPQIWSWQNSNCQSCPISIQILNPQIKNEKVEAFAQALSNSKFEILGLYNSDSQEYNLLAHMALGILGRESKFFSSWRYHVKEEAQWAVSLIKAVRIYLAGEEGLPSVNSRGPTQIKIVPKKIAEFYGITPDDLYIPQNAARATMGILIENLKELKQRAINNNWEFINPDTYVDYLPYIYFGAVGRLKKRTATPDSNIYVQDMKSYMKYFRIYEWSPAYLRAG